jgi:hypothetical protein
MMRLKYIILIVISILVVGCLTIGFWIKLSYDLIKYLEVSQPERSVEEQQVLDGISKRTGLEPDWLSIRTYVYCDLLKPGTSRGEAEKGLSQIGEFFPQWEKREYTIEFKNGFINNNLSPIAIDFENDLIVDSGALGPYNSGPRSKCELDRTKTPFKTPTSANNK